ncbi:hypothetical protein F7725_025294 [Dissostichus mawsoni]|uniref:Integrase zinc-binding domain-containing protein n=1 Tax=Dissostichus mawsoni TaxID=36200 RepID=A0A7J5XAR2_DISMA|nr:hypothetical protein F7725_025294 [Dissostichus mawsoni]
MEPIHVKELMDLKLQNVFPEGLSSHQRFVIKRRAETFRIKDGELHYICRRKRDMAEHLAKVVLSSEEADKLFKEFHCSQLGGHYAIEKTHGAIIKRFYWPGMVEDIRKLLSANPEGKDQRKERVTERLELVGMDLTNGLVEKCNGTIQRSLNKLVAGGPKRWDQFLQSTMFSLRTKTQVTTKFSPYFLMFGREARYPSEVSK